MTAPQTFADLHIHPAVLQAVADVGYETPSAIQAATIPALLAGSDVVGLAQTGTGKTAAFAIPVLSRIDTDSKHTQALVLAPTRELALQVAEAFGRYAAHLPRLTVLPIYGGQSYAVQLAGLRRGAQVVVGTPGRVIDHLERGTLDLSHLDYLVLDEADEMLQMGFAEDVERILEGTPEYKQVALFSATMPPAIRRITGKYLHDPVEVTVKSKTATAENIVQRYVQVAGPRKMDALTRILDAEAPPLASSSTRRPSTSRTWRSSTASSVRASGARSTEANAWERRTTLSRRCSRNWCRSCRPPEERSSAARRKPVPLSLSASRDRWCMVCVPPIRDKTGRH